MDVARLYDTMIRPLPLRERLELVQHIISDAMAEPAIPPMSLLSLEGLGAQLWDGVDAQQYVDELRREWEPRP